MKSRIKKVISEPTTIKIPAKKLNNRGIQIFVLSIFDYFNTKAFFMKDSVISMAPKEQTMLAPVGRSI